MFGYIGDFSPGQQIIVPFHSFSGVGASVTIGDFALADIKIYKGVSMTERASTSGYVLMDTDGVDLDGTTGIQGFAIDSGDNTTAGFFAAGNDYWIVVGPITIDGQTVNFGAVRFSIANRALNFAGSVMPVGPIPALAVVDNGTCQSGSTGGAVLRAAQAFSDTARNNQIISLTEGTGAPAQRIITTSNGTTKLVEVSPPFDLAPDNTTKYVIRECPPMPTALASLATVLVSVGTNPGQLDTSVGKVRSLIGAGGIADGAIGATTITTDAVTKIQDGLASAAGQAVIAGYLDTEIATLLGGQATIVGYIDTEIAAIKAKTDLIPAAPAAVADIAAALNATIADSVPADGSRPSISQALYMLTQFMLERSVSGTTVTVKKPDGSSTLMTLTLNDGTNPTSVTRAA